MGLQVYQDRLDSQGLAFREKRVLRVREGLQEEEGHQERVSPVPRENKVYQERWEPREREGRANLDQRVTLVHQDWLVYLDFLGRMALQDKRVSLGRQV